MKNLMFLGLFFGSFVVGFSANAGKSLEQATFEVQNALSSYGCLDAIEPVVKMTAKVSNTVRETVLYNLNRYEKLALEAKHNAENGFSNAFVQEQVEHSINVQSEQFVLLAPVGKVIGACVKSNLKFNGTALEQVQMAKLALKRISNLRKAIK